MRECNRLPVRPCPTTALDVMMLSRHRGRMTTTKRSTIYLDASLHRALRLKSAETHESISALFNRAVRTSLFEDADDLEAFEERSKEPRLSF